MKVLFDSNVLTWLRHPHKGDNIYIDRWLTSLLESVSRSRGTEGPGRPYRIVVHVVS